MRRPFGPGPGPDPSAGSPQGRRPQRRDRHGRGMRGALAPLSVPLSRTRAETFDDLVLDAVEQVELAVRDDTALADRVAAVELGVEEVPPDEDLLRAEAGDELPLARTEPGGRDRPERLVVYRRPVELRAPDLVDRGLLVHEVVVDHLAELLGVPVERLDGDTED